MTSYLSHPRIVPDTVEERKYQIRMAEDCLRHDSMIILPTGLGKTIVALIVAANILDKGKKVLLVAPTKPLLDQHGSDFRGWLKDTEVGVINGSMMPDRRAEIVERSDMVISTPQAIANDLENRLYTLKDFGIVIYDEAHRGVGNAAYVTVAKYNMGKSMGMTASPGSDRDRVMEICENLGFDYISMRSDYDSDVTPYLYETYVKKEFVSLPPDLIEISDLLRNLLSEYSGELLHMGMMTSIRPPSRNYMLEIQRDLQVRIRNKERSPYVYRGLMVVSICLKLLHCILLVETQGMTPFREYVKSMKDELAGETPTKSTKELIKKEKFIKAANKAASSKTEHPKISKAMSLVSQTLAEQPECKIMVFAQFREMCDILVEKLSRLTNAKVEKLIGQADGGLKQKEQKEVLDRFRSGSSNVLVSTSVGEEGLDISSTDLVIFYEPVASDIRTIQRRGRTGRKNDGMVYILVAQNTVDEAMESASARKEEKMRVMLERLNYDLARIVKEKKKRNQRNLDDF